MDSYTIGRVLGSGAQGRALLVTRKSTEDEFAMKQVTYDSMKPSEQKACLHEVQLLSRLSHPNIIGYHDAFLEDGTLCIVMELASGGDLAHELATAQKANEPLPEARLLDLLAQLADALHYMHACRVIHKDIKPANILLTADGTPKLADLGISLSMVAFEKQVARQLRPGESEAECVDVSSKIEGTPFYMAPELLEWDDARLATSESQRLATAGSQYSPASDVWALGVTFYELVCLQRPFSGESHASLAYKIVSDLTYNAMTRAGAVHAAHAGYGAELCAAVEGMLHKRPPQRITLSELLGREWMVSWLARRALAPPPVADLLAAKQETLAQPLPDTFGWGRGARRPRLRDDLLGLLVVQVACGAKHCAVVTDDGALYTWGDSECGQLGHGDRGRLGRRRRVASLARTSVSAAACGRNHTLAVSADGQLYAWGSHEFGQLGLGEPPADGSGGVLDAMRCALTPHPLPPPPGGAGAWRGTASGLACGEVHSACLTRDGELMVWGCPDDGRLGLGLAADAADAADADDEPVRTPTRVGGLPAALAQVACGDDFTAVLTAEGQLFGFGANYAAQLGRDPDVEAWAAPVRLLADVGGGVTVGGVAQLACGADHMAAIDDLGRLWLWGGERFGEEPRRVALPEPAAAGGSGGGAGDDEAADAAEAKGGAGDEGEGEGDASSSAAGVALVACGSGCVLAVSDAGSCFVWGDGAHGRLGLGDNDKDHATPQRLAALSTPAVRVRAAACGRGVGSLDEGPGMLALVSPESTDEFSAQFLRYYAQ